MKALGLQAKPEIPDGFFHIFTRGSMRVSLFRDELDYEAGYESGKPNIRAAEERQAKLENPMPPPPKEGAEKPKWVVRDLRRS